MEGALACSTRGFRRCALFTLPGCGMGVVGGACRLWRSRVALQLTRERVPAAAAREVRSEPARFLAASSNRMGQFFGGPDMEVQM